MKRNWIICLLAVVLAAGTFVATNSAAALALAGVSVLAPVASILFGRATAERTDIAIDFQHSCTAGQQLGMAITVRRPALSRNRIRLVLQFRNLLTGTVNNLPVTLAPASGAEERFELPLDTSCCGRIEVSLVSARATDSLGFADVAVENIALESSYTVYPPITDIVAQTTQANRSSISGTTYDYHRKGQDRTEVFDLREFTEGDSLKSVHWKLSARFGDLMVREPSRPTDYDITLLCDGHAISANAGSAAVLNGVLAVTASVSLSLIQQGLSHSVAYAADGNLESRFVDSRTSFNTMLDALVGTPVPVGYASDIAVFEEFRRAHNVTRTVLVTDAMNEDLTAQLSRITDLSVLHISEGAQAGIDRSGGYTLTHIPVETIGERIKNLEL